MYFKNLIVVCKPNPKMTYLPVLLGDAQGKALIRVRVTPEKKQYTMCLITFLTHKA